LLVNIVEFQPDILYILVERGLKRSFFSFHYGVKMVQTTFVEKIFLG